MRRAWPVLLVACGAALRGVPAADLVLTGRMHHLRLGDAREWDEFPEQAEAAALVLHFDASANRNERTLRLRHRDLKQSWCVRLNGRDVACLPPDEADTISYLAVPPDTLRGGGNELRIASGGTAPDDVLIGDVTVIDRPRAEVM